jgi:predicted GNAT family N-acyltransferase
MSQPFSVRRVKWSEAGSGLRAVRYAVFVEEQCVPEDEEWDAFDETSLHVVAQDESGVAIGTGRLLPDGHIGRMAVLKGWRGRGVGAALLAELLSAARERGDRIVRLHAQTHALGFYQKFGFKGVGEDYLEVDIPHRTMELRLTP